MPVKRCTEDGEQGWKWGDAGKCYLPSQEGSDGKAKQKAILQGVAVEGPDSPEIKALMELEETKAIMELASIIDVPVITQGTFQGHKGPPVMVDHAKFDLLLRGSNRFQPFLKQARETGVMPGNPNFFERLGKPMPAPITLNHQVLEDDKIRDALKSVEVEFSTGFVANHREEETKPWIIEKFSGVDPVIADIIRRFFQKRSVEIMELNDPETGELLPVIISTAFLNDKPVQPAVPGQTDNLLVEFAGLNESHYILYSEYGGYNMPENIVKTAVDAAELQKMQAALTAQNAEIVELKAKFEASEKDKEKAIELAKQQEQVKDAKIAELQAKQDASESDKLIAALARVRVVGKQAYQITPAYQEMAEKQIRSNGVIELAEGQNSRQATAKLFESIIELSLKPAGLLMPLGVQGDKSYQPPDQKPDKQAMIQELMQKEHISENDAWVKITDQLQEYKQGA